MATLKYSRQRESIKEFLAMRTDHPTADTVYMNIREQYPNISLGTVYRNLSLLANMGQITKISTGEGADRFDGNITPHNHFVCTCCQKVEDLEMDSIDSIKDVASRSFNGRIEKYVVNFYGVCEDCCRASRPLES